jgi:hypothetical protein
VLFDAGTGPGIVVQHQQFLCPFFFAEVLQQTTPLLLFPVEVILLSG